MRIELEGKVQSSDGEEVGTVKKAIYDERSGRVTSFVIDTGGLIGKRFVVPVERFSEGTMEGPVRLEMTRNDVDRLEPYQPGAYTAPPEGWLPPDAYPYPPVGYLWPAAPTADYVSGVAGSPTERAAAEHSFEKGMLVKDRDGDEVGVLADLRAGADGSVQELVVRVGDALATTFGGGTERRVHPGAVGHIAEGVVHLRVRGAELERADREGGGR